MSGRITDSYRKDFIYVQTSWSPKFTGKSTAGQRGQNYNESNETKMSGMAKQITLRLLENMKDVSENFHTLPIDKSFEYAHQGFKGFKNNPYLSDEAEIKNMVGKEAYVLMNDSGLVSTPVIFRFKSIPAFEKFQQLQLRVVEELSSSH